MLAPVTPIERFAVNLEKMNSQDKQYIEKENINFLGLWSIGIFCFLYSIFASNFAEIYFQASFLDFPIFVGEALLFFCLLFMFLRLRTSSFSFQRFYIVLLIYVAWLFMKAFYGYYTFGPLAFRNAALFYYPLFGVFGYLFYSKKFFTHKYFLFLLPFLGAMVATGFI